MAKKKAKPGLYVKIDPMGCFVIILICLLIWFTEEGIENGISIIVIAIIASIIYYAIKWKVKNKNKHREYGMHEYNKEVCVSGEDYEKYVASQLRKQGYHSVKITKASGDHGADIIAYAPDGVKCAIQCKYYSKPVGNKAIQEALAGAVFYECNRAIVITNTTFTKQAIEEAKKIGVKLIAGF